MFCALAALAPAVTITTVHNHIYVSYGSRRRAPAIYSMSTVGHLGFGQPA